MPKYVCTNCNFSFHSQTAKECGYCGRTNSIEEEKSAGQLLDDVDKLLKD